MTLFRPLLQHLADDCLFVDAKARGLPYVELTTDPDNVASQRVILKNGGVLVERFDKGPEYHNAPGLRYRIDLG